MGQRNQDIRFHSTEEAPYVVLSVQATGIHPYTDHLLTLDALTLDGSYQPMDEYSLLFRPAEGDDPGPIHLHGLSPGRFSQGRRFGNVLRKIDRLIDHRTLIVHNAPLVWGMLVMEACHAMGDAARANKQRRSRSRGNQRNNRVQRVGHVPKPEAIVDTLAGARRAGVTCGDERERAIARALGLDAPPAVASVARAQEDSRVVNRHTTELVLSMHQELLRRDHVVTFHRGDLTGDPRGLQRTTLRVDAAAAPAVRENPGVYRPGGELQVGMEFTVAPEIEADPDRIIAAGTRAGLTYSEKFTRESSLVVCNATHNFTGKAMQAQRKDVPLLSDVAFLDAVARLEERGIEAQ